MKSTLHTILVFFALLAVAAPAYAQYGLPGVENSLSIVMSPEHPSPNSQVVLSLESSIVDLPHTQITWLSGDGTVLAAGIGKTNISVPVGALGSQTTITAEAALETTKASAQAVITPTEVDLLYESDSYTPPFYAGRALPSAGTNIRLQAIANFKRGDGSSLPDGSIIYTWRQNGKVVGSASGAGRSFALLPSPALFATDAISVQAETTDGMYSGSASVTVPSTEPALLLYQDHPLFGVMYHRALSLDSSVTEPEMTFIAMPYFAHVSSPDDSRLQYSWQVNQQQINADKTHPSEITVNSGKSAGVALIELSLSDSSNIFTSASGKWGVSFSTSGRGSVNSGSNPFDLSQ